MNERVIACAIDCPHPRLGLRERILNNDLYIFFREDAGDNSKVVRIEFDIVRCITCVSIGTLLDYAERVLQNIDRRNKLIELSSVAHMYHPIWTDVADGIDGDRRIA